MYLCIFNYTGNMVVKLSLSYNLNFSTRNINYKINILSDSHFYKLCIIQIKIIEIVKSILNTW